MATFRRTNDRNYSRRPMIDASLPSVYAMCSKIVCVAEAVALDIQNHFHSFKDSMFLLRYQTILHHPVVHELLY